MSSIPETGLRHLLSGPDGTVLLGLAGATAVLPLLALTLGRRRRWPVVTVLPALLVSILVVGTATRLWRHELVKPYLRVAIHGVAVPFELLFIGWILWAAFGTVRSVARSRAEGDFHARIRAAVHATVGDNRFGELIAAELSTLYYGLFSWFARPRAPAGKVAIAYRKSAGWGAGLPAIVVLIALETTLLHLLLARFWPRADWILTLLSAYAIVWVVADDRAALFRPMLLDGDELDLKAGLRWDARLPLSAIARVRCLGEAESLDRHAVKKLGLLGRPQLLVELKQPLRLDGLFGRTATADQLALSVDDWPLFRDGLTRAGVAIEGELAPTSADFYERLRDGLRGLVKKPSVADSLARELSLLVCALFFWRLRPSAPAPGGHAFTIHRRSHYGAIFGFLLGLSILEMTVVHLFLQRVSPTAEKIVLILAAYGLIWFFGDLHALRLRPILVENGMLRVRVGVRREVDVALADIDKVEPSTGEPPRRAPDYARCTAFGPPDVLVRLRKPADVDQLLGKKHGVSTLGLKVDDAETFQRIVKGTT